MIIEKTNSKAEYKYANETGDAQITVYRIFPGIEVSFLTIHMSDFDFTELESMYRESYVGFHYCLEGRIEQELDGEFFYLLPGDLSVVSKNRNLKVFVLPLNHYHGISIGVDTNVAMTQFSEYIQGSEISPLNVVRRICGTRDTTILRSSPSIQQILAGWRMIPEEQRPDYLKIKMLELLYVLSQIDADAYLTECFVPREQTELVKRVSAYVSDNIQGKIAIVDLTAKFGVSETYLQKAFRSVYGMPVVSFIRAQRMQCAAQVLIHTTRSIDDIAEEFGYVNESKFASVFKRIIGDTPSVYRREHSKVKIL